MKFINLHKEINQIMFQIMIDIYNNVQQKLEAEILEQILEVASTKGDIATRLYFTRLASLLIDPQNKKEFENSTVRILFSLTLKYHNSFSKKLQVFIIIC